MFINNCVQHILHCCHPSKPLFLSIAHHVLPSIFTVCVCVVIRLTSHKHMHTISSFPYSRHNPVQGIMYMLLLLCVMRIPPWWWHSRDYRRLLVQLEETERRFDDFWNSHLTRLRQCLELRLFEQDFRELQVRWISNVFLEQFLHYVFALRTKNIQRNINIAFVVLGEFRSHYAIDRWYDGGWWNGYSGGRFD